MAEPITLTGLVEQFVVGLSGIGVGGYAVWRKLRRDRREDGLDERFTKQIDSLQLQLEAERVENSKLGGVIDTLSAERNEAVRQVGQLEGQVAALRKEVHRLHDDVGHLQKENTHLREEVHSLRGEVAELTRQIVALVQAYQMGGANGG